MQRKRGADPGQSAVIVMLIGLLTLSCSQDRLTPDAPAPTSSIATEAPTVEASDYDIYCQSLPRGGSQPVLSDSCLSLALLTKEDFVRISRVLYSDLDERPAVMRSDYKTGKLDPHILSGDLKGYGFFPDLREFGQKSEQGCALIIPLPLLLQEAMLDTVPLARGEPVTSAWAFREFEQNYDYVIHHIVKERLATEDMQTIREQFECTEWTNSIGSVKWQVREVACPRDDYWDDQLCLLFKTIPDSGLAETHIILYRKDDIISVLHRGRVSVQGVSSTEWTRTEQLAGRAARKLRALISGQDPTIAGP